MTPDRGLARGTVQGGVKNKARLTYLFCPNGDGSDKRPPFVIGKAEKPLAFKRKTGKELGLDYAHDKKAWMTASLFSRYVLVITQEERSLLWGCSWLQSFKCDMKQQGRRVVLLLDNFSGHDGLVRVDQHLNFVHSTEHDFKSVASRPGDSQTFQEPLSSKVSSDKLAASCC